MLFHSVKYISLDMLACSFFMISLFYPSCRFVVRNYSKIFRRHSHNNNNKCDWMEWMAQCALPLTIAHCFPKRCCHFIISHHFVTMTRFLSSFFLPCFCFRFSFDGMPFLSLFLLGHNNRR